MTDARSLLRQQRDARRIQHSLAAYSDAGKLLCTLCREQIRTEALWDNHLKSAGHRSRIAVAAAAAETQEAEEEDTAVPAPKRKLDDGVEVMDIDDTTRSKRTKADNSISEDVAAPPLADSAFEFPPREQILTPPSLIRRASTTPSQGIELQIPSRPATPAHRDSSSSSTPGGSVLQSALTASSPRKNSTLAMEQSSRENGSATGAAAVDESEWAAFEADIAAASVPYDEEAVISAPAMNAEQAAAAAAEMAQEYQDGKRKLQVDIDIEDEKEDATRALEDEFDEMQELEARVKKLKDQRAALRQRAESHSQDNIVAELAQMKEEADTNGTGAAAEAKAEAEAGDDDEDDDDDSEDDDEWDGFRFRR